MITLAPRALAICKPKIETPPVPRSKTLSPAFIFAAMIQVHAVTAAQGKVAAS